jgi:hypothetical protein
VAEGRRIDRRAASDAAYTTSASQEAAAGSASLQRQPEAAGLAGAQKSAGLQRKIIYTAEVSLVVTNFRPRSKGLSTLVQAV